MIFAGASLWSVLAPPTFALAALAEPAASKVTRTHARTRARARTHTHTHTHLLSQP